jgi:hypothetical protein
VIGGEYTLHVVYVDRFEPPVSLDRVEEPFGGVLLAREVSFAIANVDQVGVGGLQRHWGPGGGADVALVEVVPAYVDGDGVSPDVRVASGLRRVP